MTEKNKNNGAVRQKKEKSALEVGLAGLVDKWAEENGDSAEAIFGKEGLFSELKKAASKKPSADPGTDFLKPENSPANRNRIF